MPSGFGPDHQRVERRAIEQGGRRIPGRHLLLAEVSLKSNLNEEMLRIIHLQIRSHFWEADGRHPGMQEAQEDGHHWSIRYG